MMNGRRITAMLLLIPIGIGWVVLRAMAQEAETSEEAAKTRALLNPLATMTVSSLSGFAQRPLFSPSRTAPEAPSAPPEEPPAAPVVEAHASVTPPNMRLVGVVGLNDGRFAVLQDLDSGAIHSVHLDESVSGWRVVAVEPAKMRISNGSAEHEFVLFKPSEGAPAPDAAAPHPPVTAAATGGRPVVQQ